jgi:hypothetical protein
MDANIKIKDDLPSPSESDRAQSKQTGVEGLSLISEKNYHHSFTPLNTHETSPEFQYDIDHYLNSEMPIEISSVADIDLVSSSSDQSHSLSPGMIGRVHGRTTEETPPAVTLPVNSFSPQENGIRSLNAGRAGEHIVLADLYLSGLNPMKTGEGCVYDLALDFKGKLIKIQCKSTLGPRDDNVKRYRFSVTKSADNNTHIRKKYSSTEVDIIAFVALDLKVVAYLPLSSLANWNVDFYSSAEILKSRRSSRSRLISEYPIHQALSQLMSKSA